jgi:flagellar L-ring protein precursor FlgH
MKDTFTLRFLACAGQWMVMVLTAALAGCAGDIREIGREPAMSPVGAGLTTVVQPSAIAVFLPASGGGRQSLWNGGRADIFSDPRAARIGDVVTIHIAINDSATFGNATDRSLDSHVNTGFDWKLGLNSSTNEFKPTVSADASSSAKGEGSIDRSEKIQLSVAAVVTDVLPNGNLIVSGSQEVRVNYELRLLNIAGIIRPRDISKDNTISYDKVAEARISYGGRGRIMEVQQPAWGQQVYDHFKPL